jgi:hypothetical protein
MMHQIGLPGLFRHVETEPDFGTDERNADDALQINNNTDTPCNITN